MIQALDRNVHYLLRRYAKEGLSQSRRIPKIVYISSRLYFLFLLLATSSSQVKNRFEHQMDIKRFKIVSVSFQSPEFC